MSSTLWLAVLICCCLFVMKNSVESVKCTFQQRQLCIDLDDSCDCIMSSSQYIQEVRINVKDTNFEWESQGTVKTLQLQQMKGSSIEVYSHEHDFQQKCFPSSLLQSPLRRLFMFEGNNLNELEVNELHLNIRDGDDSCISTLSTSFFHDIKSLVSLSVTKPRGEFKLKDSLVSLMNYQHGNVRTIVFKNMSYLSWNTAGKAWPQTSTEIQLSTVKISPDLMVTLSVSENHGTLINTKYDDVSVSCRCGWIKILGDQIKGQIQRKFLTFRCAKDSDPSLVDVSFKTAWNHCYLGVSTIDSTDYPEREATKTTSLSDRDVIIHHPHVSPAQMIAVIVLLSLTTVFILCLVGFAIFYFVRKGRKCGRYTVKAGTAGVSIN